MVSSLAVLFGAPRSNGAMVAPQVTNLEPHEFIRGSSQDDGHLPAGASFPEAAAGIKVALEGIGFTCISLHEVGGWFRAPSGEPHFISVWTAPAESLYETREHGLSQAPNINLYGSWESQEAQQK